MRLPGIVHGRRRRQLAFLVGSGLAQAGIALLFARELAVAVDATLAPAPAAASGGTGSLGGTGARLALLALLALATGLLRWRERVVAARLAQSYVHRVRERLLRKLLCVAPAAWQRQSRGGMLLRFTGDLTAIGNWVSRGLARLTVAATLFVALTLGLLFTQPGFAWLPAALLLPAAALAAATAPRLDAAVVAQRRTRARLATRVGELLAAVVPSAPAGVGPSAKCASARPSLEDAGPRAVRRHSRRLRSAACVLATRAAGFGAALDALALLAPVAVLAALVAWPGIAGFGPAAAAGDAAGGAASATAALAPGASAAARLAGLIGLATLLAAPLRELARVFEDWRRYRVARGKLSGFLRLPEQRETAAGLRLVRDAAPGAPA